MIFDYDVHHGNGTHDIFYDESDILFVSTHHQHTAARYFPAIHLANLLLYS